MVLPIDSINPNLIAQVFDAEKIGTSDITENIAGAPASPFDDILNKAINSFEGVEKLEMKSNDLISKYIEGHAELSDVMVAAAKTNIAVQLAVTVVTSTVTTFKEITQMQV